MAVKIQVEVLWVVTPCSVVVGYHCFRGPCCHHLQSEVSGAWLGIQVVIFWFVTPCGGVVGYQHFGVPCCLHLQSEVSGARIGIQVIVFWVVTPCSVVVGYPHFREPCYLHLQGELLVSYHNTTWHHNPEDLIFNLHIALSLYHLDLILELQGEVLQYLSSQCLCLCFTWGTYKLLCGWPI
jgi:hypothetical protein